MHGIKSEPGRQRDAEKCTAMHRSCASSVEQVHTFFCISDTILKVILEDKMQL